MNLFLSTWEEGYGVFFFIIYSLLLHTIQWVICSFKSQKLWCLSHHTHTLCFPLSFLSPSHSLVIIASDLILGLVLYFRSFSLTILLFVFISPISLYFSLYYKGVVNSPPPSKEKKRWVILISPSIIITIILVLVYPLFNITLLLLLLLLITLIIIMIISSHFLTPMITTAIP